MQTTAVVIGAGHAGLAMSRRLTERSIDHVVLERGEVANSWRTQRWPSLRLLTPNWQTRLPGHDYAGGDPDGYMPAAEVVATLTRYARLIGAPVRADTTVRTVRAVPQGFEIHADDDVLHARAVVLATGACNLPAMRNLPHARPVLAVTFPYPGMTLAISGHSHGGACGAGQGQRPGGRGDHRRGGCRRPYRRSAAPRGCVRAVTDQKAQVPALRPGPGRRDRGHRGSLPPPDRRPARHHLTAVRPAARRSHPHPARGDQQRRLRRILALPPCTRAPAAPPRHSAGPVHTRGLTHPSPGNEPHPSASRPMSFPG